MNNKVEENQNEEFKIYVDLCIDYVNDRRLRIRKDGESFR